jgi:GNAT superfamily N-acetyltransferase
MTSIRVLRADEADVLDNVAADVFDHGIDPRWRAEFFADPRHHLAVAIDGGRVVGMASGVHYVHPDKEPELWINEVGVADTHRAQGIGRRLLAALLEHAVSLGCHEAWVLTNPENAPAVRMYTAAGGMMPDEPTVMFTFPLRARDD